MTTAGGLETQIWITGGRPLWFGREIVSGSPGIRRGTGSPRRKELRLPQNRTKRIATTLEKRICCGRKRGLIFFSPSIDPVPQDPRNVKNVNELPCRLQFPHELSKNALATSASTRVVKKCLGDLSSLLSCQKKSFGDLSFPNSCCPNVV